MSDSLQCHESQHARPPCPSPTPGVHSDSRPLSPWCHPAISSSVVPFSTCPQSLPASKPFPMSQLFTWGGQSIGVSAPASVLPMNAQDWFPLGWTGWISLQSKRLKSLLQNHSSKASILWCSAFFIVQISHPYMSTGKTIALINWTFVGRVMFLLLNMLSRLIMVFLPRSKGLLISWLQSPSAVMLEPQKIKSDTVSSVSPSISHEVLGSCSQPPLQVRRHARPQLEMLVRMRMWSVWSAPVRALSWSWDTAQRRAGSASRWQVNRWAPSWYEVNLLEDQSHLNSTSKSTSSKVELSSS